jgi:hypothetical protein
MSICLHPSRFAYILLKIVCILLSFAVTCADTGVEMALELSQGIHPNLGSDFQQLVVVVEEQTPSRLHVKIMPVSDAQRRRAVASAAREHAGSTGNVCWFSPAGQASASCLNHVDPSDLPW